MDATQQRVYLACVTALGASAVPALGLPDMPATRTDRLDTDVTSAITSALAHLVDDTSIESGVSPYLRALLSRLSRICRSRALSVGCNARFTLRAPLICLLVVA